MTYTALPADANGAVVAVVAVSVFSLATNETLSDGTLTAGIDVHGTVTVLLDAVQSYSR